MKKNALIFLLAIGLTFSTLSSAQTEVAASVPTRQHASPVSAPGYLGLTYSQSELHVTFSDVRTNNLSPKFISVGLAQRQESAGFRAVHSSTSLTEIVNYYWGTLTKLGFEGLVSTATRDMVTYTFANGDRDLTAVFTRQGSSVVADLSWTHTESVAAN